MGAFYGSMLIRTENSGEVQNALEDVAKSIGCKFLQGPPVFGWISVFPNHRGQSDKPSIETSKRLSYDIFHLIVHDDDIFLYYFFRGGQLVDHYNSCPDYFQEVSAEVKRQCRGRPELFQDLLRKPELLRKLYTLLSADSKKYTFEEERMRKFVELLGLPNAMGSYEFLDAGEREGIKGWKQFIYIPDLRAEKAAAQNKIKAEKEHLQKDGVLLAEIKLPNRADLVTWGMESLASKGFIVAPDRRKQPVIKIKGLDGARGIAVHPSEKFAVLNMQGALAIIDLEKQELMKKLAVNRRMESIDPFVRDSKGLMAHAWLKNVLKNPETREKLGVNAQSHSAIVQDSKAVEQLPGVVQQNIKTMLEQLRRSYPIRETQDQVFDVRFSPNGEQLFIASEGMRVFDWKKLLSAHKNTPRPEFSVDAPIDDETDPNSRALAYCVRFDSERNLLLSGCLAGVIQYLNATNGQSGTLLKLPGEVCVWQLELTDDRNALCCYCRTRLKRENIHKKEEYFLQVWNYRALCEAAGLP